MIQSGSIDMRAMSITGDFIVKGVKFSAQKEFAKLSNANDCRKFIKSFDPKVSVGTLKLLSSVSKDVMYKVYDGTKLVNETHDFSKVVIPQNDNSQVIVFGAVKPDNLDYVTEVNKNMFTYLSNNLENSRLKFVEIFPKQDIHTAFISKDGSVAYEKYGVQDYDYQMLNNNIDNLVGFYVETVSGELI